MEYGTMLSCCSAASFDNLPLSDILKAGTFVFGNEETKVKNLLLVDEEGKFDIGARPTS
jgi:hypothetical protein